MQTVAYYTDHYVNQLVTQFFSKSQNLDYKKISEYKKNDNIKFCSYGILRGTGDAINSSVEYIYIDHGFFKSSNRNFNKDKRTSINELTGYFRVIKNDLYFNKNYTSSDKTRFNNLRIPLKDLNQNGEFILMSEPSEHVLNYLKIPNWKEETLSLIQKYSDKKIVIHNKFSELSLDDLIQKAFAFVSCQSTAAFKSIAEGVPAYFTHESLSKFGSVKNIEDRYLNHDLLFAAANSQWQLKEFFSDEFKSYLDNINC